MHGIGSTSELRYQAVRPLRDQLSAAVRFLPGEYVDGGPMTLEFTLTNKGGADITDITAGCGRSGEGPHVDLNGNGWMDGQEHLTGVSGLGLVGALTLLVGGASVFLARRRTA